VHDLLNRLERVRDDELDANRRSEVNAPVTIRHQIVDGPRVEDRPFDYLSQAVARQMVNVAPASRAEVIEDHNVVAPGDQRIGDMRADEPSSPGDQVPRSLLLPRAALRSDGVEFTVIAPFRRECEAEQILTVHVGT
jgi:hypothetical protein